MADLKLILKIRCDFIWNEKERHLNKTKIGQNQNHGCETKRFIIELPVNRFDQIVKQITYELEFSTKTQNHRIIKWKYWNSVANEIKTVSSFRLERLNRSIKLAIAR